MRIGIRRGLALGVALVSALMATRTASADGFHRTIPREVLAQDIRTGGPYYAPPIPYGHYAKDGFLSCLHGGYFGKGGHCCGLFGCGGCGLGCGLGKGGHGLLGGHGGHGDDDGCGKGGCGLFHKGGGGCGLFGRSANGCDDGGCGTGHAKRIKNCGLCKNKGCGVCEATGPGIPIHSLASAQSPAPVIAAPAASPQGAVMAGACGDPGCSIGGKHKHLGGNACGSCFGKGCGKCGGMGLFGGHGGDGSGFGDACGGCGGRGCGLCGGKGFGNGGCGACGGKGCGLCSKFKGLLHGGHLAGLLHKNKIKYFVGAGGPIPLTPGYTPYVVTTRSPRDFFSFPPYTPEAP